METEAFNNKRVALGLKPITRYYREQTMSFPIQSQQTGSTTIIKVKYHLALDGLLIAADNYSKFYMNFFSGYCRFT
jgi:hypothetical protein